MVWSIWIQMIIFPSLWKFSQHPLHAYEFFVALLLSPPPSYSFSIFSRKGVLHVVKCALLSKITLFLLMLIEAFSFFALQSREISSVTDSWEDVWVICMTASEEAIHSFRKDSADLMAKVWTRNHPSLPIWGLTLGKQMLLLLIAKLIMCKKV